MSEIKNLGLQIRMFILIYLKGMHQTFLYPTIISGIMLLYLNQWMLVFFISWLFLCFYCVGISKFGRVFCYYLLFFLKIRYYLLKNKLCTFWFWILEKMRLNFKICAKVILNFRGLENHGGKRITKYFVLWVGSVITAYETNLMLIIIIFIFEFCFKNVVVWNMLKERT